MARTTSEEIAHLHLQWYAAIQDGREDEVVDLQDRIQRLSDLVGMRARQRNEAIQEIGVS